MALGHKCMVFYPAGWPTQVLMTILQGWKVYALALWHFVVAFHEPGLCCQNYFIFCTVCMWIIANSHFTCTNTLIEQS